mgnify:CR=1 FL=1
MVRLFMHNQTDSNSMLQAHAVQHTHTTYSRALEVQVLAQHGLVVGAGLKAVGADGLCAREVGGRMRAFGTCGLWTCVCEFPSHVAVQRVWSTASASIGWMGQSLHQVVRLADSNGPVDCQCQAGGPLLGLAPPLHTPTLPHMHFTLAWPGMIRFCSRRSACLGEV